MKKKLITILFAVFCLSLLSGCTLHFKASEMEIDNKPIEGKIGSTKSTNHTYELASADIF